MNKRHQWKAKNSRIEYLLAGVSRNTKNESKMQPKVAWGSKNRKPREFSLFE